jgi:hypothetical protein
MGFSCLRLPSYNKPTCQSFGKLASNIDDVADAGNYGLTAAQGVITLGQHWDYMNGEAPGATDWGSHVTTRLDYTKEVIRLARLPLALTKLLSGEITAKRNKDGERDSKGTRSWIGIAISLLVVVARIFNFVEYLVKKLSLAISCIWVAITTLSFIKAINDLSTNKNPNKAPKLARQVAVTFADFAYMPWDCFTFNNLVCRFVGGGLGLVTGVAHLAVAIVDNPYSE